MLNYTSDKLIVRQMYLRKIRLSTYVSGWNIFAVTPFVVFYNLPMRMLVVWPRDGLMGFKLAAFKFVEVATFSHYL